MPLSVDLYMYSFSLSTDCNSSESVGGSCELVTHSLSPCPSSVYTCGSVCLSVCFDLAGVSPVRPTSNHRVGFVQMRLEIGHCRSMYATRHFLLRGVGSREGPWHCLEGGEWMQNPSLLFSSTEEEEGAFYGTLVVVNSFALLSEGGFRRFNCFAICASEF